MSTLVDRFHDREILADLNAEETRSFVDLLILTVLIDGEITDDELDGLADQWSQLPFAGDAHLEDLVSEHGNESRAFLQENFDNQEEIQTFIERVCARLTRSETQEAAIHMVGVVSTADGFAKPEHDLAYQIGAQFGFDAERVDTLLDEVITETDD